MTDQELIERAQRFRDLKAQAKEAEDLAEEDGKAIVAELRRRRAVSLEKGGLRITRTSRRFGYDVDSWRDRVRPGVFRSTTRTQVDPAAVQKALSAGKVSAEDIAACEKRTGEYPVITAPEAQAAA